MMRTFWLLPVVGALVCPNARAETTRFELGFLDLRHRAETSRSEPPREALCRNVLPQTVHIYVTPDEACTNDAFSEIVRKEPGSYSSDKAARGVVTLGSQRYAFVLVKEGEGRDAYRRLYFDLNRNGDLTDDEVIEAVRPVHTGLTGSSYRSVFPRIDLRIDVDGVKADFAFFLEVVSTQSTRGKTCVDAMFRAAAYRHGTVKLKGQPTKIVVLDYNSNGRFDDVFVRSDRLAVYSTTEKRVFPQIGDKLLVDSNRQAFVSAHEWTYAGEPMSKLIELKGRFYDLSITGAGDRLVLTPSSVPIGYVTNHSQEFCAIVYDENRCLKFMGPNGQPVPLPVGHWTLASCIVSHMMPPESDVPVDRVAQRSKTLHPAFGMARRSQVWAQATVDSPRIELREGRTVEFPFGPPYTASVDISGVDGDPNRTASLRLSLIGAGKEACNRIMANGKTMPPPTFTINTKAGERVEGGLFDGRMRRSAQMALPETTPRAAGRVPYPC